MRSQFRYMTLRPDFVFKTRVGESKHTASRQKYRSVRTPDNSDVLSIGASRAEVCQQPNITDAAYTIWNYSIPVVRQ